MRAEMDSLPPLAPDRNNGHPPPWVRRLSRFLLRQHNLGRLPGAFKDLVVRVAFYVSMVNFLLIGVTAWSTTLYRYAPQGVRFEHFIAVLVLGILLAVLLEYKFMMASSMSWHNQQLYRHDNPIREDIARLRRQQERLATHLGIPPEEENDYVAAAKRED